MIRAVTKKLGPEDHGRRMSLKEFEPAEVQEGYQYELGRGVVVVSDVPKIVHLRQVSATRKQFLAYDLAHPGVINEIASGHECKILLFDLESERHPDLAIYLTAPPKGKNLWADWIPAIVIEVVSLSSEIRDYEEKREEYFAIGIKEYWIADADKGEVLVLRRGRGKWVPRTMKAGDIYETKLLPGFRFDCQKVFEAAEKTEN
jgi:Uma2 family endonuclease